MKLVRAGQPVVGMSAEMVSLACGVRASVEGVQLGGDGKVATIYRCAGTDFTIRNGRVAEILRR